MTELPLKHLLHTQCESGEVMEDRLNAKDTSLERKCECPYPETVAKTDRETRGLCRPQGAHITNGPPGVGEEVKLKLLTIMRKCGQNTGALSM